jgi:basic amino acid/polyamine antiporter, APA family
MTTNGNPVSKGHLLKVLGIGFGLAISIGSAIGVGILRSPGLIAGYIDSAWLVMLAWVIGGIYCLLAANVLSELATMMPRSGGGYVYASRGLGKFAGFVVGVCDWFQTTAALAFLSVVFGEYASRLLVPDLAGRRIVFSVGILLTLSALNAIGVRTGSEMQMLTSALKALALIAFVVACFVFGGQTPPDTSFAVSDVTTPSFTFAYLASFILGLQLVLGTYEGWQGPVYFSEENTDPSHSLPRSLYGGILLIIVI